MNFLLRRKCHNLSSSSGRERYYISAILTVVSQTTVVLLFLHFTFARCYSCLSYWQIRSFWFYFLFPNSTLDDYIVSLSPDVSFVNPMTLPTISFRTSSTNEHGGTYTSSCIKGMSLKTYVRACSSTSLLSKKAEHLHITNIHCFTLLQRNTTHLTFSTPFLLLWLLSPRTLNPSLAPISFLANLVSAPELAACVPPP